ncbi:MAG: hypothetical protein KAS38_02830 [Anaerolineales bacterium]|nr:hypothetical protein [Anaerolineales bacterium]
MLQEADYNITEAAMNLEQPNARFAGDDKLFVVFFMHPRRDEAKSVEEGRPMFKDEEYVRIMVPGDKDSIVIRPARDMDKQRFHKQYAAFTSGEGEFHEGTPLKAWPMVTRGQVEELKYFGVHTVEQLADLADVHVQKFMAVGVLKTQAQAYIQAAKEAAPLVQLNAAIDQKDAEIGALTQAVDELKEIVESLQKPKKKKAS